MNDGGPAFPTVATVEKDSSIYCDTSFPDVSSVGGMSLRDWFAGQIVSGLLSQSPSGIFSDRSFTEAIIEMGKKEFTKHVAEAVFELADAMLAERNKTQ